MFSDHNHDKSTTTPEFINLAAGVFTARLAQANLVTKTNFDVRLQSLNKRLTPKQNICLLKLNYKIRKISCSLL